ncbi:MAG: hypothetical protein BWY76_00858 [bacterium ADurb.Bin429]|nr:MAG: hypothetical protein BWY76_00858 [bacterium ADurb.Bin429]
MSILQAVASPTVQVGSDHANRTYIGIRRYYMVNTCFYIGLHGWVLFDNIYSGFQSGQIASFALKYSHFLLQSSRNTDICYKYITGMSYDVIAKTTFTYEDVWVIDFGLTAYDTNRFVPPEWVGNDSYVSGVITLQVDPFYYSDIISRLPGAPPLIYSWEIHKVFQFTSVAENIFYEIDNIDMHAIDSGDDFLLECSLADALPRYKR